MFQKELGVTIRLYFDSINAKLTIDYDDIALKFVSWKYHADYTPYKEVFAIGNTCNAAISKYNELRKDPLSCGLKTLDSNGNGSLMRILPIAYYATAKHLKDFEIIELVKNISSITHAHPISQMGCYIFVRFIMFLLNDKDKFSAYSMTKCVDYSMFGEEALNAYARLLKDDITKYKLKDINSTSYIVDTLEATIWISLKSENYKEAIIGAINLGGDTSTIGALTGAACGIIYSYDQIPEQWLAQIARREYLMDIFEEFSENKYQ